MLFKFLFIFFFVFFNTTRVLSNTDACIGSTSSVISEKSLEFDELMELSEQEEKIKELIIKTTQVQSSDRKISLKIEKIRYKHQTNYNPKQDQQTMQCHL